MDTLALDLASALDRAGGTIFAAAPGSMPLEVAETIVYQMALEDVMDGFTVEALFPHLDLSWAMNKRKDVASYLSTFVKDAESFIRMMLITNSFIAGSRAVEFFLPGSCTPASDWDVYCCGNGGQRSLLLYWMIKAGFKPASDHNTTADDAEATDYPQDNTLSFGVLDGTMDTPRGNKKVQLIHPSYFADVETVLNFHSSVVQCFISGYGAVSLMSGITRRSESMAWSAHTPTQKQLMRIQTAVEKYRKRGITYVDKDRYSSICGTEGVRSMAKGCCIVDLEHVGRHRESSRAMAEFRKAVSMSVLWQQGGSHIRTNDTSIYETVASNSLKESFHLLSLEFTVEMLRAGEIKISGRPPGSADQATVLSSLKGARLVKCENRLLREQAGDARFWVSACHATRFHAITPKHMLRARPSNLVSIVTDDMYMWTEVHNPNSVIGIMQ